MILYPSHASDCGAPSGQPLLRGPRSAPYHSRHSSGWASLTHVERSKRASRPCTAHDMVSIGRCLNCGFGE